MIHASQDLARRYPAGHATAVVVDRPAKRTSTGGVHRGSRAAIIREARAKAPKFADAAAVEIFYGTDESKDTVVIFDLSMTPVHGL